MLVLSRKKSESIMIGNDIEITVLEVMNDVVKIGISAPKEVGVLRKELYVSVEQMNRSAESSDLNTDDLLKQFGEINKKAIKE